MPLYSYFCMDCGTFDQMRSMSDYQKPANCPQCGQASDRQITAVQLNLMAGTQRTAHRLNEKNAHEPRIRQSGGMAGQDHGSHGHVHGPGCGHSHGHAAAGPQPTASRPWQVGH